MSSAKTKKKPQTSIDLVALRKDLRALLQQLENSERTVWECSVIRDTLKYMRQNEKVT